MDDFYIDFMFRAYQFIVYDTPSIASLQSFAFSNYWPLFCLLMCRSVWCTWPPFWLIIVAWCVNWPPFWPIIVAGCILCVRFFTFIFFHEYAGTPLDYMYFGTDTWLVGIVVHSFNMKSGWQPTLEVQVPPNNHEMLGDYNHDPWTTFASMITS